MDQKAATTNAHADPVSSMWQARVAALNDVRHAAKGSPQEKPLLQGLVDRNAEVRRTARKVSSKLMKLGHNVTRMDFLAALPFLARKEIERYADEFASRLREIQHADDALNQSTEYTDNANEQTLLLALLSHLRKSELEKYLPIIGEHIASRVWYVIEAAFAITLKLTVDQVEQWCLEPLMSR